MSDKHKEPDENLAQLNKPLAFVIFMLGTTFAVLNLQAAQSDDNTSLLLSVIYGALAFVSLFVTVFWIFDAYQTRVTERYVQKGKTQIAWHEVTEVKNNEFSVVLKKGNKSLVINYFAYRQPEALAERIKTLLATWKSDAVDDGSG